jgi:ankyrin repeat protein
MQFFILQSGETPLSRASWGEALDAVSLLLKAGAKVDLQEEVVHS